MNPVGALFDVVATASTPLADESPETRRSARRSSRADRAPGLPRTLAAVVLGLLGVGIMLYPSAASWFSDVRQQGELGGYAQQVSGTDPEVLAARLDAARQYNAALPGGVLRDPFGDDDGAPDGKALDYLGQITADPRDVMAEVRIPGISALLPVYHGTSDETLRRGIGHLYGSSLPVGGAGTHAVLTGHRGYPEATMFTDLDRVGVGETFTINVLGETLTYRVFGTEVVLPDETSSLSVVPGRDLVTLITCTPTGVNTHRLFVHAERVAADDPASEGAAGEVGLPFPWWMLVALAAMVAAVIVVARRYGRGRRGRRDGAPRYENRPRD